MEQQSGMSCTFYDLQHKKITGLLHRDQNSFNTLVRKSHNVCFIGETSLNVLACTSYSTCNMTNLLIFTGINRNLRTANTYVWQNCFFILPSVTLKFQIKTKEELTLNGRTPV